MIYYDDEPWHPPPASYRVQHIREKIPLYSIDYDPVKSKFIVERGLQASPKEFTTKRSAVRFVKRWLDKLNGIKVEPKKIPFKTNKIRIQERKRKAQEELDRLEQEENMEFLERIGANEF